MVTDPPEKLAFFDDSGWVDIYCQIITSALLKPQ